MDDVRDINLIIKTKSLINGFQENNYSSTFRFAQQLTQAAISDQSKSKERLLGLEYLLKLWKNGDDVKIAPLRDSSPMDLDVSTKGDTSSNSSVILNNFVQEQSVQREPDLLQPISSSNEAESTKSIFRPSQKSNLLSSQLATTKRRGRPLGSVNKPRSTKVTLKKVQNTTSVQKTLKIQVTDDDYDQRLENFLADIVDNPRVYKSKNLIEEKDIKMTEWSDESYSFYEI